jgi:type II secretory pathway predicted ATPase ExeA
MYEEFYGLKENPFSIQPDPEYLFMGKRHSMAYAMLEYSIRNKAGFAVISGDIGCGKTTLIRKLLEDLGENTCIGLVYNTHQDIANLLEWIMLSFGQPYADLSQVQLYDAFQRFLIEQYGAGKRVLLIVDEAQNLHPAALESLRMLSNINADKHQLLQMILVGQPQLKDLLRRPDLKQFAQRVSAHIFITPLEQKEVGDYIKHRLMVAGRTEPLFMRAAIDRIAEASQGTPRVINTICDMVLVYGFSGELQSIDANLVDEVLSDQATFGVFSLETEEPTK